MNLLSGRQERNTYKQIFLSTAAASCLLLAVAAVEPAVFSWATKAQAATNVSTSINFYDELAPYGNWVLYHERYVWIPEGVDDSWQPYTKGHWAYTRRHGWIWMSDEKFGWATYHYGRWGQAPDIGWYWLPGSIWAPAWVAWTYDNYDIAWAPLPADYSDDYDDVNIDISFSEIPDDHWQALSVSAFLADDLSSHMFRDRDKVRRVIERGKPWTVSIENNIVVNTVLTIDNIEKRTKKKVVALEEKVVDNPDAAGKGDSTSVAIFKPEVKEEPDAKPKEIRTVEEMVKAREAKIVPSFDTVQVEPTGEALIAGHAEPGSEVVVKFNGMTVGTAVANADGAFVITPDKPLPSGSGALSLESKSNEVVVASAVSVAVDVKAAPKPAEVAIAQEVPGPTPPVDGKKKTTASVEAPAGEPTASIEEKKKQKATAAPDQQAVEKSAQAPADEQAAPVEDKKKQKVAAAPDQQPVEKSAQAPAEVQTASIENKKKKKAEEPANTRRKGNPQCDPAVADCPPAQTLSKPKRQSTKRVLPMTNLRGAESWRINCSPRFGDFTKASETYLSSAGKRVSCAMRPKNAKG